MRRRSIWDRLDDEYDARLREYENAQESLEPTEDEKKNGWTPETLTAYVAERKAQQSLALDPTSLHSRVARRPAKQNNRYNPFRWRN